MLEAIEKIRANLPAHVRLVAISKTRSIAEIQEARKYGLLDFGENRIQELCTKITCDSLIQWHMIGHLQRNKVKEAVQYCTLIQSVDSLRLLDEIHVQAKRLNKVMPVLFQVNLAKEETKGGFMLEEVEAALKYSQTLDCINLQGFMVIGPHCKDESKIRHVFKLAQQLYQSYQDSYHLTILSMGMSSDYQIAIEYGSTMVRIGSSLFIHS